MSVNHPLSYLTFPTNPPQVKHIVFMIHGYGSNASDLITLAPDLGEFVADALFISPNGCEAFEGGVYGAYQWYSLIERTYSNIRKGTENAAGVLESFIISCMKQYGLEERDIMLLGFSQGAMMCLHSGYRMEKEVAGVVSLCGRLNMADLLSAEIKNRPDTILIHGAEDKVVDPQEMYEAEKVLLANEVKAQTYLRPLLAHGIDKEAVNIIGAFMREKWV